MNIDEINTTINESLSFFNGPLMSDFTRLFIIVFATKFVPDLPDTITGPMDNVILRLLAIFIIVWLGNKNPVRAFAVAIGFVVAINLMSGRGAFEDPEPFGLMDGVQDKDQKYAKERAEHRSDYEERDAKRRNPNRVHSVVEQNNRHSQDILDDFGIPMAMPYESMF